MAAAASSAVRVPWGNSFTVTSTPRSDNACRTRSVAGKDVCMDTYPLPFSFLNSSLLPDSSVRIVPDPPSPPSADPSAQRVAIEAQGVRGGTTNDPQGGE